MPRINELPTYETILEFQKVYVRAVALSWRDPEFAKELRKNPKAALANNLGYICPWNLDLEIQANEDIQQPETEKCSWSSKDGAWKNVPRNGLKVGIPQPPQKNNEQAIALAAYSDAGPTYLFTCC